MGQALAAVPDLIRDTTLVRESIAELVKIGDTETLSEVARQASAGQLYERSREMKTRADAYGRLKVLAEAAIGKLDIQDHPRSGDGELMVEDKTINKTTRQRWRRLALAYDLGMLDTILDAIADDPEQLISTKAAADACLARGIGWLNTAPLVARWEILRKDGWVLRDLAVKAGLSYAQVREALKAKKTPHATGIAMATAMGLDPNSLCPPRRAPRGRYKKRRRKPPQWKALTGGQWDKSYAALRKALQEFAAVAGEDIKYDEAYAHFYALEDTIGKALKRGGG